MLSIVSVQDLRVGMFVHLDLGWMQHPFPRSSFRILAPEQIAAIRELGLQRVRWDPQASVPVEPEIEPPAAAPSPPEPPSAQELQAQAARARLAQHQQQLAELERECDEANRALQAAGRRALNAPAEAGAQALALSRKLLDRMSQAGEHCIRLVNGRSGDRSAAHGLNVAVIALLMGRSMGLDEAGLLSLSLGAMFHDVGKLELPHRMRHHDEGFSANETRAYRDHVAHGLALGQRMGLDADALAVIAQHHERADAQGFPQGLSSDRMTPAARIVAVADGYDNLCNPAVATPARTPHEAVAILFAQQHRRFDAALMAAFVRTMGVYPAGTIVQLSDGRHAMVMAVNPARPLRPQVLVHDPAVPADEALLLDLESEPGLSIRGSLPAARLPADALAYLAPRDTLHYFFEPVQRPTEAG